MSEIFTREAIPPMTTAGSQEIKKTGAQRLADWFKSNCNGDWEHGNGIKIETTDNPGWLVTVDLDGTPVQELTGKVSVRSMTCEIYCGELVAYDEETGDLEGLLNIVADVLEGRQSMS